MRALLIDDERRLHELLGEDLAARGVTLLSALDGRFGLALLAAQSVDVVLLDGMMQGLDGLDVLRRIRERSAVPVVMLTARGDEADRVVGLELGADDCVSKPFSPRELVARMRAVVRRGSHVIGEHLRVGLLDAEPSARNIRFDGVRLELTGIEHDLLLALLRRPGRELDRDALLAAAGRGDVFVSARRVRTVATCSRRRSRRAGSWRSGRRRRCRTRRCRCSAGRPSRRGRSIGSSGWRPLWPCS